LNRDILDAVDEDESSRAHDNSSVLSPGPAENVIDMNNRDPLTGSLHHIEKMKLKSLLERWEEPERYADRFSVSAASTSSACQNTLNGIIFHGEVGAQLFS